MCGMKMKRKQPDSATATTKAAPKRRKSALPVESDGDEEVSRANEVFNRVDDYAAATKDVNGTPRKLEKTQPERANSDDEDISTPKPNGKTLFATQRKMQVTSSHKKKADRSAKKKSVQSLLEHEEGDEWESEQALAREILEDGQDLADGERSPEDDAEDRLERIEADGEILPDTPSKRGRGRPKGAKNKRSPTPEGDIPPEERYFFQNRSGPPQISNNTMTSVKLLTHEEYFEQMRLYGEDHVPEKAYLMRLHARSFPQWRFELDQGFSICLYGWGSKRKLSAKFAEWLQTKTRPRPTIVVINGYTPKLNVRSVLNTLASVVMGDAMPARLVGQPHEVIDTILSHLSDHPPSAPISMIINSVDAQPLRKTATQHLFARLATHPNIQLLVTSDTPTVSLLWNSSLLDQFKFLFHDCTTYAPYDAELNVVDDVHELLGHKGRRIGGKEGVGFVLKSLPENARNLYRVLLTEILSVLSDDHDDLVEDDQDERDGPTRKSGQGVQDVSIEYRSLYQKASEEFICSSDMNFRFLLKEFHDHQMITSSRDASGTELLGVPLAKEDIEGVLEDLVLS